MLASAMKVATFVFKSYSSEVRRRNLLDQFA